MLNRQTMRRAAAVRLKAAPVTLTTAPPRVGPSEGLIVWITGSGAQPNRTPSPVYSRALRETSMGTLLIADPSAWSRSEAASNAGEVQLIAEVLW